VLLILRTEYCLEVGLVSLIFSDCLKAGLRTWKTRFKGDRFRIRGYDLKVRCGRVRKPARLRPPTGPSVRREQGQAQSDSISPRPFCQETHQNVEHRFRWTDAFPPPCLSLPRSGEPGCASGLSGL